MLHLKNFHILGYFSRKAAKMVNKLEIILQKEKLREVQVCIRKKKKKDFEKCVVALQSLKSYILWKQKQSTCDVPAVS